MPASADKLAADQSCSSTLTDRCAAVDMLLTDVDGVLTDGSIIYDAHGVELKVFNVRDGLGFKLWQRFGKQAGIVSGRSSGTVEVRAAELGLHPVRQGVRDKGQALQEILHQHGLQPRQVCFVGDDLPDLPIMVQCGLAVAVADACPQVVAAAHYRTTAGGGKGAVRETIELILRAQGHWPKVMASFGPAGG